MSYNALIQLFNIVQSPRKGTNEEFSNVCRELINQFLLQ